MIARRGVVALVAAALVLAVGCGDDDPSDLARAPSRSTTASTTTSTEQATSTTAAPATTEAPSDLPPLAAIELEPLYREALTGLGLRLTARGGLIDRTDSRYEPSPTGTHLALYVEPVGDRTPEQYVEGLGTVTVVFSDVFDRWPGLESFDVCQEPVDAVDSSDEPQPITQIDMTRSQAAAFDWSTVRPVDVVRAALAEPRGIRLRISPSLADHPSYQAVLDEARSAG